MTEILKIIKNVNNKLSNKIVILFIFNVTNWYMNVDYKR